ncbi:hypothetical protein LSG31_16835 [Fodinisporobacter ferrooxydans]|uniref:Uncharacterized protein n=1 Tax=Fodinisporobacter ferrooxydans TaxID=2901836 RepID=A0ABY4CHP7_9BACL|nr:hypothetical protein LSG31_16835 [Alicyclobacillaceae bacterium MYW30-H2]
MKKFVIGALATLAIAAPLTAFASTSPLIVWQGITTYLPDAFAFDVKSVENVQMDLVQYPTDGTSAGTADMVYDIGDYANGYWQEIYGNYTNSDAYVTWSNVQPSNSHSYNLEVYNKAYWTYGTPGLATDGNGYVYY